MIGKRATATEIKTAQAEQAAIERAFGARVVEVVFASAVKRLRELVGE